MKTLILASLLLGSSAFAAGVEKICTGIPGTEFGYEVLYVKLTPERIWITSKDTAFEGDYPANGDTGVLSNGAPSIAYEDDIDGYHYYIKVDQNLLKPGTKGQIQIRSIHEGYGDDTFNCGDKSN